MEVDAIQFCGSRGRPWPWHKGALLSPRLSRQAIGLVEDSIALLVAHMVREEGEDEVIRLISAGARFD